MQVQNTARFATVCLLAGALACASNTSRVDDETAAAAQDTTMTEVPPGYSGMERDTTMLPDTTPTAVDTFLLEQGTGVPADTQGYGGLEQPADTGYGAEQPDTGYGAEQPAETGTGWGEDTTSGTTGQMDTSGYGTPQPGQ
ncbi:MAG TPA: hypothetical protein VMN37_00515 [Gemmatimonadales bacterium]|nr:hypothetical protein [Gemmatimonadales bacterium]